MPPSGALGITNVSTVDVASAEISVKTFARLQNQRSNKAGPRPPMSESEKVNKFAMLSACKANAAAMMPIKISAKRPIQT